MTDHKHTWKISSSEIFSGEDIGIILECEECGYTTDTTYSVDNIVRHAEDTEGECVNTTCKICNDDIKGDLDHVEASYCDKCEEIVHHRCGNKVGQGKNFLCQDCIDEDNEYHDNK